MNFDSQSQTVIITKKAETSVQTPVQSQPQQKLLKFNGEATTWPYWTEKDDIYIEYKDCIQLLTYKYRAPWHTVTANPKDKTIIIDSKVVDINTKTFGDFTAFSLNNLKANQLIDYTWDAANSNLVLK